MRTPYLEGAEGVAALLEALDHLADEAALDAVLWLPEACMLG